MKPIICLLAGLALFDSSYGQFTFPHAQLDRSQAEGEPPLLMPEERKAVDDQTDEFTKAIAPALAVAAKSTVRIWAGSQRLAYGTVVGTGKQLLSKWSEVADAQEDLRVDTGNGSRAAKIAGVYPDEDLALLDVEGDPLTPVTWSYESPKLGAFLATPQPDGRLAAFGVVSVLTRNLRDTDLAYLGVIGELGFTGHGVKIGEVAKGSGAEAAGIQAGNVILKVGDRSISGLLELKNALTGSSPGSTIPLLVEVDGQTRKFDVLLGNRPKLVQPKNGRLEQMEQMGGSVSQVRDSFTSVFQTDMRPKTNQVGGPVVDLQGHVIGITVARADRTRSFIMPAAAVTELLKKVPTDPQVAQVMREADEEPAPLPQGKRARGKFGPNGVERARHHLRDMQKLMDFMREEMDALDRP